MSSYSHTIKYQFLKTSPKQAKPGAGRDSPTPSQQRRLSLSPPRRADSPSGGSRATDSWADNNADAVVSPAPVGRKVSFLYGATSVPADATLPRSPGQWVAEPLPPSQQQPPAAAGKPKWAKGKREWSPEKLMATWDTAAAGGMRRQAEAEPRPTDVIETFWQSHYGDVCPYKLKLPEKKLIKRRPVSPKPKKPVKVRFSAAVLWSGCPRPCV